MRLIIGFLLALVLVGCSSDPSPHHPSSSAGSPRTTPTPTRTGPLTTGPNVRPGETPPELPADARTHDSLGAISFAFYYFKALDWSYATNEAYLLASVSAPRCETCNRLIARIRGLSGKHQTLLGGRITVRSAGVVDRRYEIPADFVVKVRTEQRPTRLVNTQTGKAEVSGGETTESLVFVVWSDGSWMTREVTAS